MQHTIATIRIGQTITGDGQATHSMKSSNLIPELGIRQCMINGEAFLELVRLILHHLGFLIRETHSMQISCSSWL